MGGHGLTRKYLYAVELERILEPCDARSEGVAALVGEGERGVRMGELVEELQVAVAELYGDDDQNEREGGRDVPDEGAGLTRLAAEGVRAFERTRVGWQESARAKTKLA